MKFEENCYSLLLFSFFLRHQLERSKIDLDNEDIISFFNLFFSVLNNQKNVQNFILDEVEHV